MAFATGGPFGTIESTHTARRHASLDGLAIQTACGGMLVPSRKTSHLRPQRVMDALPGAISTPLAKISVDALPFGILLGQHAPLDAAHRNVQDGIDDLPHIQAAGSSTRFRRWNHFLDNVPLAVG